MGERGYQKLIAWQVADELVFQVYQKTKTFPSGEMYGVTAQLRRAAVSIPTNIAEGMGRQSSNETRHFLNIALGSLAEVEYLLTLSERLGFFQAEDFELLESVRSRLGSLLYKIYKSR